MQIICVSKPYTLHPIAPFRVFHETCELETRHICTRPTTQASFHLSTGIQTTADKPKSITIFCQGTAGNIYTKHVRVFRIKISIYFSSLGCVPHDPPITTSIPPTQYYLVKITSYEAPQYSSLMPSVRSTYERYPRNDSEPTTAQKKRTHALCNR